MFDDRNYIDEIEDLRDQIHDLEQDLRDETKERHRLEDELSSLYKDDGKTQASLEAEIKDLQELALARNLEISRMSKITFGLDKYLDGLRVNYVKALSVAESLTTNGNMDYFKTTKGHQLLDWAVTELKAEANKIMREEI